MFRLSDLKLVFVLLAGLQSLVQCNPHTSGQDGETALKASYELSSSSKYGGCGGYMDELGESFLGARRAVVATKNAIEHLRSPRPSRRGESAAAAANWERRARLLKKVFRIDVDPRDGWERGSSTIRRKMEAMTR